MKRWRFRPRAPLASQPTWRRANRNDQVRAALGETGALLAELRRNPAAVLGGLPAKVHPVRPQERPEPHGLDLRGVLEDLRMVVEALTAPTEDGDAPTYPDAAARARLPLGTFHDHLAGVRRRHREAYARLMAWRRDQLAQRHRRAELRREQRSKKWHRRQAARRLRERFGRYPWELRP
ncbi:MAG TPA: hypothetical protein VGM69_12905 [Chloroflexota bacterium]